MGVVLQDLRYTWRTIHRSPGFVIAMITILALGVGANTAIFSVVYGIVLRPLPFVQPDQLFAVFASQPGQRLSRVLTSGPDYADFREQNHSFQQIADVLPYFTETLVGEGEPQVVRCTAVSPDFFSVLSVRPLLGRFYRKDEFHPGAGTVVISYNLWQRVFHGRSSVIGHAIRLGDSSETVIGIAPRLPDIYPQTDVWPTLIPDFPFMKWRGNRFLEVLGRLKPGVSPQEAEQDLTAILQRAPETPSGMRVALLPLKTELTGNAKPILTVLMSAAGLVLLVACVNVATLLLARSENRKQEISLRLSLGASRRRILQQLFTENLVIALIGGTVGVILASYATTLIVAAGSGQLPRSSDSGINPAVLSFTLATVCVTSILFGLMPSLALLKTDLNSALRSGRSALANWSKSRRTILIAAEVSLSVVLLVGAGLLIRSVSNLMRLDLGFEPEHLVTAHLRLADGGFATPYQLSFYQRLFADLPHQPGIDAVAVADCIPGIRAATASLTMADRPVDPNHLPAASGCWISADYFRATATPLLNGRSFDERDNATAPLVAVINNALARRYWPHESPIGKEINVSYTGPGRRSDGRVRWRQIVGVVADMKQNGLDQNADPAVYLPFYQDETGHIYRSMHLFARARSDAAGLAGTVRASLRAIEPNLPVTIQPMTEVLSQSVGPRRFTLLLLTSFATLATMLAGFGIYGVVSYAVARRTREIGVRMALGADRADTLRVVLHEVLVPVTCGLAVGTLAALAGSQLMGSILYRTPAADSMVLLSTVAIMFLVAVMAAALPAYRAASVDPMRALRAE